MNCDYTKNNSERSYFFVFRLVHRSLGEDVRARRGIFLVFNDPVDKLMSQKNIFDIGSLFEPFFLIRFF